MKRFWMVLLSAIFTATCALLALGFFVISVILCGFFIVNEDTSWLMFFITMGIGGFFSPVTIAVYQHLFVCKLGYKDVMTKWLALAFGLFLTLAPFILLTWYLHSCHHVKQKDADPRFCTALIMSGLFFGALTAAIYLLFRKKEKQKKRKK